MVQCSFKVNTYPCTVGRAVVASEATRTSCSFRPPSKWMRPPSSSSRRWSARPSGSCHVTETEKSRMTSQWFCIGVSRLLLGWDFFVWFVYPLIFVGLEFEMYSLARIPSAASSASGNAPRSRPCSVCRRSCCRSTSTAYAFVARGDRGVWDETTLGLHRFHPRKMLVAWVYSGYDWYI